MSTIQGYGLGRVLWLFDLWFPVFKFFIIKEPLIRVFFQEKSESENWLFQEHQELAWKNGNQLLVVTAVLSKFQKNLRTTVIYQKLDFWIFLTPVQYVRIYTQVENQRASVADSNIHTTLVWNSWLREQFLVV